MICDNHQYELIGYGYADDTEIKIFRCVVCGDYKTEEV
jgi:hypothetical protein